MLNLQETSWNCLAVSWPMQWYVLRNILTSKSCIRSDLSWYAQPEYIGLQCINNSVAQFELFVPRHLGTARLKCRRKLFLNGYASVSEVNGTCLCKLIWCWRSKFSRLHISATAILLGTFSTLQKPSSESNFCKKTSLNHFSDACHIFVRNFGGFQTPKKRNTPLIFPLPAL